MKVRKSTWMIGLLSLVVMNSIAQQDSTKTESSFSYEGSYVGDVVNNLNGGIKTGTNYLGMANIGLGFDIEKAGWWKGAELYANFGTTHGDMPSANLIGDIQVASNIEAGDMTYLFEFWYKQKLGNLEITLGMQDLNANFVATENGGLFLNSSFGVHTVMSDNITLPIFPTTALGANLRWSPSDCFNWQIALFDGTPNSRNPYNTNLIVGKEDGYLLVSEFQFAKSLIKGQKGTYKLGGYYHKHEYSTDGPHENGGGYLIIDQNINKRISVFTQIGFSPNTINDHNHFYSLGVNYKEFSAKRPEDKIGLAVAYFDIDKQDDKHETTIEITYQYMVNDNIYIQPDLQYIINPSGTDVKLDDAIVGSVRFGIEF